MREIKRGKYFKIISMNVNGYKYYFVCNTCYNGFIRVFRHIDYAIEKFKELEKCMEDIDKIAKES